MIFVTGSNGMLGHVVCVELGLKYQVTPLTKIDYDFSSMSGINRLVSDLQPDDIVINCCGLIRQRLGILPNSKEIHLATLINSVLPHAIAERCKLIHISTDCVFSGSGNNYLETSLSDAQDVYGKTKSLGETQIATVLRTSIVGPELYNHLGLYDWFMNHTGSVVGYQNHYWNGVTTKQLAKCIDYCLENNLFELGIRHVFSPTTVSKYELLNMFATRRQNSIEIKPVDAPISVNRTLATIYPEFVKSLNIPSLEQQIQNM
jgi:dTDP-4-dehydrorhamnose reductase